METLGFVLIIISSLFIPGIIGITKAKMSGRKAPSVFQPVSDVIKLLKKGSIYSETTSFIFQIAPVIYFSSIVVSIFFIPLGEYRGVFSFDGDFVYFAYLLAIGKFLMIISAMDTGSGFEGMGANREALYSMLVEPVFFILMGSLALLTNHISFHDLYTYFHFNNSFSYFIGVIAIYLFLQIAIIENCRLLLDDPKTHLELTMIHEVMVLDNSGFDMGIIHIGTWLKFSIYSALISNFLLPKDWSLIAHIGIFLLIPVLFGITIGVLESFRIRNKIARNPEWILTFSSVSLVLFLVMTFIINN